MAVIGSPGTDDSLPGAPEEAGHGGGQEGGGGAPPQKGSSGWPLSGRFHLLWGPYVGGSYPFGSIVGGSDFWKLPGLLCWVLV